MTPLRPMPLTWRAGIMLAVLALATTMYFVRDNFGASATRVQAGVGFVCFLGFAAAVSQNLRAVRLKTIFWGIVLQFTLAMAITQSEHVYWIFKQLGHGIKKLAECSDKGSDFVFGSLAKQDGPAGFVFAFKVLPQIIFVSGFFSVLYYLGILQFFVNIFARIMMYIMGTSGAETLSVSANVFMGQTEAPLIVKPFVPRMTMSELMTMMASGMAHISGSLLAVYIGYGADPVSILCACVIACPCSLYVTKLFMPETGHPETTGDAKIVVPRTHANVIDALASGIKDGLMLALNVAAMLIGFTALIALIDLGITEIKPGLVYVGIPTERLNWWPDNLKLETIFGFLFEPIAFLIGVDPSETKQVGTLLGIKLAINEHMAFFTMKRDYANLSPHSKMLAVYALAGFANFASVGIQIGGIGAIAPDRRADLAKLGLKALFIGYLVTLINASVAGMLPPPRFMGG